MRLARSRGSGLSRPSDALVVVERPRPPSGFTLIEVLVVVAIIALLIAILLPSLRDAREQAKIVACRANTKQIGNLIATYQSEAQGYVPVLYNYGLGLGHEDSMHGNVQIARTSLLSVALRAYSASTRKLPEKFDPDKHWDVELRQEFEDTFLPEHYVCPFVRGKGPGDVYRDLIRIGQAGRQRDYKHFEWMGRHDCYSTFKFEGSVVRREHPHSFVNRTDIYPLDPNPNGPVDRDVDGRPKYSAFSFNRAIPVDGVWEYEAPPGFDLRVFHTSAAVIDNLHRKWTIENARFLKSASFSDVTIVTCLQGENMGRGDKIRNIGNHRTSQGGGTNVIFADFHSEWVKGRQVGWQ